MDGERPKDARGEDGEVMELRSEGLSMIVEIIDEGRDKDVMLVRRELLLGPLHVSRGSAICLTHTHMIVDPTARPKVPPSNRTN